jgi:TRAP-type C4-dicarboxylate transport system permease small subunit
MDAARIRTGDNFIEVLLALAMAGLVFVTVTQVLLRYLTDQPLAWTEEFARFLFVWACFLGAAVGSRRGAHFAIGLLVDGLGGRTRTIARLVIQLVETAFYVGLAWSGWLVTRVASFQESSSLEIPMSIPYSAIPVCSAIMAWFTLHRAYRDFRSGDARC